MRPHALYFPSLAVALAGGAAVVFSALYQPARAAVVGPMTYVCASVALVLFVRILLDPRCHKAIAAANREMHGDQPFRSKWPQLDDPQWGLFGNRAGDRLLLSVRALLLCEFGIALL